MFIEEQNQAEPLLERSLQNSTSVDVEADFDFLGGSLVFFFVLALIYLCAAIYMFCYLCKKDEELPLERRVFGPCCMIGYILVCLFTPVCFTFVYFCVTLGMINDNKQTIVSPYNNNTNYNSDNTKNEVHAATPQDIPVAVAIVEKGSPAAAEEQV